MSNLKLEHLRTFLAVARFKSVRRAAEALHLTQTAATSRIKALEDEAGTTYGDLVTKKYPQLKIEISVDISVNLRDQLLGRESDLAILLGPISDYMVDNVILPDVELAWFRAPGGAPGDPVDLSAVPIATYARNTRPYRELRAALFERFGPDVTMFPSSSLSSCFRMVEAGLGVGALPLSLGAPLEREG